MAQIKGASTGASFVLWLVLINDTSEGVCPSHVGQPRVWGVHTGWLAGERHPDTLELLMVSLDPGRKLTVSPTIFFGTPVISCPLLIPQF